MIATSPLISADELADLLADPAEDSARKLRLLDVRWTLSQPDGRADYAAGHIPGAVYVSLDDDLASHSDDPKAGRHPLPNPEDFEDTVRSWGIDATTPVVVYDDNRSLGAARAWWLLRWAGLDDVRVLDGGMQAWREAVGELSTETPEPMRSDFHIQPDSMPTLTADKAAQLARTGTLLDARAPERYRGETEPLDAKAGHIPGARNRPATANTDATSHTFAPAAQLREAFAHLGVGSTGAVGVYCGSGVTACTNALALAQIGIRAALYPASWSGWSADPDRPVNSGDE